ncbi:S-adenosyl-L-methionine-dependent methyltransferase [Rickenella mellea]|uniref:S-adenosyl-L-methionine-dependent methyltransferase n=1 Tax=Rickenella mellea TaxID=50990 RepID=A0A4R5XET5_9AGAM|nr:S-adenosyl-L-methionine-dependent methyltransferase [Rickenella mellea]
MLFHHQCFARRLTRSLAVVSRSHPSPDLNSAGPFQIFDREAKRMQKDRAARKNHGARSRTVDYVFDEVAEGLFVRFEDIKRKFDTLLELGSGAGRFSKLLETQHTRKSVLLDCSRESLYRDENRGFEVLIDRINYDEERLLEAVQPNSQEAIVSCLSLHWVNDLPGILVQIKEALKPDGLFLGALLGGETLFELRTSLQLAQVDREGGISPHISPMTDIRDMSNLMGRAGFNLITVDLDEITCGYPSMWELMDDLRDMGESNAVLGRPHFIHRDTLAAASAIYKEMYGNEDGSIPATFQVIYLIGWKPAATQPKPLPRGSAKTNLKDIL